MLLSVKDSTPLGTLDYCGFGLWIFGFLFEVVADTQKTMFRSDAQNKDKFIHTGLWSISRHPNYFGEIALWTGVFISAIAGLLKLQTPADILYHIRNPQFLTLLFSPTFVYLLLNFVSGVPMLEKVSSSIEIWLLFYTVDILFHDEWCTSQLWCSSIKSYNLISPASHITIILILTLLNISLPMRNSASFQLIRSMSKTLPFWSPLSERQENMVPNRRNLRRNSKQQ